MEQVYALLFTIRGLILASLPFWLFLALVLIIYFGIILVYFWVAKDH